MIWKERPSTSKIPCLSPSPTQIPQQRPTPFYHLIGSRMITGKTTRTAPPHLTLTRHLTYPMFQRSPRETHARPGVRPKQTTMRLTAAPSLYSGPRTVTNIRLTVLSTRLIKVKFICPRQMKALASVHSTPLIWWKMLNSWMTQISLTSLTHNRTAPTQLRTQTAPKLETLPMMKFSIQSLTNTSFLGRWKSCLKQKNFPKKSLR